MAEFLSQKEIDSLLGVAGLTPDDFPYYAHIKRGNQFGVIEINEPFLESKLGINIQETDTDNEDIQIALKNKGIEVLQEHASKKELVMSMYEELETFKKRVQEMKHIKKYLDDHPEYLL